MSGGAAKFRLFGLLRLAVLQLPSDDAVAAFILNNRPSVMLTGFANRVVSLPPARHMNLFFCWPHENRRASSSVDEDQVKFSAARAQGPGGQKIRKWVWPNSCLE